MDGLNWWVYCRNNPLKYVDPTGMWGPDVHRDKSKQWAMDIGFTEKQAGIIAFGSYWVDFFPFTNPIPIIGDQRYHFNVVEYRYGRDSRQVIAEHHLRIAKVCKGISNISFINNTWLGRICEWLSLFTLGMGLHAIQDMESHTDNYIEQTIGDVVIVAQGMPVYHHLGPKGFGADGLGDEDDETKIRVEVTGEKSKEYLGQY
jgi:hypothetical protein